MELCIIIPAKNEEGSLRSTITEIYSLLIGQLDFNILVVNDHSTDSTLLVLDKLSKEYKHLNYVDNTGKPGVGNAIKFGLGTWKGDILAICMADASDSPADVLLAYDCFVQQSCDCVFGSRFIKGASVDDYPKIKLFLNRLFNNTVKILSGNKYNDYTNIFKLYSRSALDRIGPINSEGFSIGLEMSLKSYKSNLSIAVIPISWRNRKFGESKLNLIKNVRVYFSTLISILRNEK